MSKQSILWQRLDLPGHDFAALERSAEGWQLNGVALVLESHRPCRIDYFVGCDESWVTRRCFLRGNVGATGVALEIERSATGVWTIDGVAAPTLDGCVDIDLGFTPVTNLLPIRRLKLEVGARADVRAAWVRFPQLSVEVLEQVYTRLDETRYLYESAGGAFRRELVIDEVGFVVDYPGIWRADATSRSLGNDDA